MRFSWGKIGPLLAVTCAVAGCAARVHELPLLPSTEPAAVYTAVREREDGIQSMRARFMVTQQGDGGSRQTEGILLVRKPDRLRFRLLLPLGGTLFDYVSVGDDTRVSSAFDLRPDNERDYGIFTKEEFGLVFLRGPFAFPGTCIPSAGGAGTVLIDCREHPNGDLTRKIVVDSRSGVVLYEINFVGPASRLKIQYDDFRMVNGFPMAYRIWMTDETRHLAVQVTVDKYEINPILADALFKPAP